MSPENEIAKTRESLADEVRKLVRLDHRDRHREERSGYGDENIACEAASTHAEHDDLLDALVVGQPVEVSACSDRLGDLLGQGSRRLEHAGTVDRPGERRTARSSTPSE